MYLYSAIYTCTRMQLFFYSTTQSLKRLSMKAELRRGKKSVLCLCMLCTLCGLCDRNVTVLYSGCAVGTWMWHCDVCERLHRSVTESKKRAEVAQSYSTLAVT